MIRFRSHACLTQLVVFWFCKLELNYLRDGHALLPVYKILLFVNIGKHGVIGIAKLRRSS